MNFIYTEEDRLQDIDILYDIYKDQLFYKGQHGVKGLKIDISPVLSEQKLEELQKCEEDPIYFLENYVYIENKDLGVIKFVPRSFQKKMVQTFIKNRFVLSMVSRQLGKTIVMCGLFLWYCIFHKNFTISMIADRNELAQENLTRIKFMYERLPIWMQEGIKTYNSVMIVFENNSRIKSKVATKNAGRGGTENIVYADELSAIDNNIKEQWIKSSFPSITSSKKTKFFATFTPKGLELAWKLFTEGKVDRKDEFSPGRNGFVSLEFPWNVDGIRDEIFRKDIISKFGLEYWEQEYECKFIGSGKTLLSSKCLEKLVAKDCLKREAVLNSKFVLKIYKEPMPNNNYIVTHDSSEGLGGENDETAIIVWDVTIPLISEQVAVMNSNEIDEDDAPWILRDIGKKYNTALVISEINFFPHIPKNLMMNCDYDNVFLNKEDNRFGLKTTEMTRKIGLSRMRKELENDRVILHDFDTIRQFYVFSKNKSGKYEAQQGYHDDLVTSSYLLFWLMCDPERYEEYINSKMKYFKDVKNLDVDNDLYDDITIDDGSELEVITRKPTKKGGIDYVDIDEEINNNDENLDSENDESGDFDD